MSASDARVTTASHRCPSCGASLISEPAEASLRCPILCCGWRLITLEEWRQLKPLSQGYALYMQGSWPTSEIAGEKNPHAENSAAWTAFREGERRAMLDAQDGEE